MEMESESSSQEESSSEYSWRQTVPCYCLNFRNTGRDGRLFVDWKSTSFQTPIHISTKNQGERHRSSSMCTTDSRSKLQYLTSGFMSSSRAPIENNRDLHEIGKSAAKDLNLSWQKRMSRCNTDLSSSTLKYINIERLYGSSRTDVFSILGNSTLRSMFFVLMVGAGMHSPPENEDDDPNTPRRVVRPTKVTLFPSTSPKEMSTPEEKDPKTLGRVVTPSSSPKEKSSPGDKDPELPIIVVTPPKLALSLMTSPQKKSPPRSPRESLERIKAFPKIPKRQFTTPEKSPEKNCPMSLDRQISRNSSNSTPSLFMEDLPCGAFKLPSRDKMFRPPRDPFAIPEKFEPVVPGGQSFDFTTEPEKCLFPSLMFFPKNESGDVPKVEDPPIEVPKTPSEPDKSLSDSPERDNSMPASLIDPSFVHFPYFATGDETTSGGSRRLHELGMTFQHSQYDPLQQSAIDAMKDFSDVYGQFTGLMENRILNKLTQMAQLIAQVRNSVLRVSHTGALLSPMCIPQEISACMNRVKKLADKLKQVGREVSIDVKYGYWMYINLKYRPLSEYRYGTGSSRLDDIHSVKAITKIISGLLMEATDLISLYKPEKRKLKRFMRDKDKQVNRLFVD